MHPALLVASTTAPPYLAEAVALVVGSAVIAYVCYRVHVQPSKTTGTSSTCTTPRGRGRWTSLRN